MPRARLEDFLQSHLFWAFDASFSGLPVFNPLFGFSKVTAPQITAEVETFKDGTFIWNRSLIRGAAAGSVTFERAASMFDSDFYQWIAFALYGNRNSTGSSINDALSDALGGSSPRKNIMIVQFSAINLMAASPNSGPVMATATGTAQQGPAQSLTGQGGTHVSIGSSSASAGLNAPAPQMVPGLSIGSTTFALRVPARAWLLRNCLPIRYKAASDFDANNAAISLQELEVMPESIEEISLSNGV